MCMFPFKKGSTEMHVIMAIKHKMQNEIRKKKYPLQSLKLD